jgi:hypothetical protein
MTTLIFWAGSVLGVFLVIVLISLLHMAQRGDGLSDFMDCLDRDKKNFPLPRTPDGWGR